MGAVANLTLGSGEHIYTTIGAVSPKSVLTNLSSKFDRFLAVRSQFGIGHRVDFYAHTCCQFVSFGPLFVFYSRTPLIRPPSESHWCGRIRGMVAREGFVYEQKPLSVTRNVVV